VAGRRELLVEAPLRILVEGMAPVLVMRTPGQDRELVMGFLLTEGVVAGVEDVLLLTECPDEADTLRVRLGPKARPEGLRRATASVSACGVCGRESMEGLLSRLAPLPEGPAVPRRLLYGMAEAMRRSQRLFDATGASHAAAAFSRSGEMLALREDAGRHNAVDKLAGWALLSGCPHSAAVLFLSGRLSGEIVIKAVAGGFPVLAGVSAPTSLGVELAERLNLTLCGFCRGQEATLYAHAERLAD